MICESCRSPVPQGAAFCLQCGGKISAEPEQPAVASLEEELGPGEREGPPMLRPTLAPTPTPTPHTAALPPSPVPAPARAAAPTRAQPGQEQRRLVGWIACFDFEPCGRSWALRLGRTGIGRDPTDNLVHLDRDPTISRRHAALIAREGGLWLRDSDSEYGTRVNGSEIGLEARALSDGDRIQICGYTLTVRLL